MSISSEYSFNNAYNATVNVATNAFLTGPAIQVARVGAASYSFDRMWIYTMDRRDLYEVFGTYYLYDQPIRVDDDVYYTNAIQDMWASFARTGNPNVDKSYLITRGYNSTLAFFSDFVWPSFNAMTPQVASLQFPGPAITTLPDQERIAVLAPFFSS
ncbi:unnamed protein product [Penicillium discolor]